MIDSELLQKHILQCAECGEEFVRVQPVQKFCSDLCRGRHYRALKRQKKEAEAPKKRDLFAA
jgi:hypothetical protein